MKLFYVKFTELKKPGPTNVFAIVARDQLHLESIAIIIGPEFVVLNQPTDLSKHWN